MRNKIAIATGIISLLKLVEPTIRSQWKDYTRKKQINNYLSGLAKKEADYFDKEVEQLIEEKKSFYLQFAMRAFDIEQEQLNDIEYVESPSGYEELLYEISSNDKLYYLEQRVCRQFRKNDYKTFVMFMSDFIKLDEEHYIYLEKCDEDNTKISVPINIKKDTINTTKITEVKQKKIFLPIIVACLVIIMFLIFK